MRNPKIRRSEAIRAKARAERPLTPKRFSRNVSYASCCTHRFAISLSGGDARLGGRRRSAPAFFSAWASRVLGEKARLQRVSDTSPSRPGPRSRRRRLQRVDDCLGRHGLVRKFDRAGSLRFRRAVRPLVQLPLRVRYLLAAYGMYTARRWVRTALLNKYPDQHYQNSILNRPYHSAQVHRSYLPTSTIFLPT